MSLQLTKDGWGLRGAMMSQERYGMIEKFRAIPVTDCKGWEEKILWLWLHLHWKKGKGNVAMIGEKGMNRFLILWLCRQRKTGTDPMTIWWQRKTGKDPMTMMAEEDRKGPFDHDGRGRQERTLWLWYGRGRQEQIIWLWWLRKTRTTCLQKCFSRTQKKLCVKLAPFQKKKNWYILPLYAGIMDSL